MLYISQNKQFSVFGKFQREELRGAVGGTKIHIKVLAREEELSEQKVSSEVLLFVLLFFFQFRMISIYVQILLIIFFWSTDCQIIPRIEECGLSCSQVIPCSNLLSINTVVICCQNNCRKKKKGKREKCFSCPEHSLYIPVILN